MASSPFTVWQWNCRGFKAKRRALEHTLQAQPHTPHIIALQETYMDTKLTSYAAYNQQTTPDQRPNTAILVHRNLAANHIDLSYPEVPHTFVQVLPNSRSQAPLHILNVYSPPSDKSTRVATLVRKACATAQTGMLLILGDFNAPHTEWGYPRKACGRKGAKVWETAQTLGLTLLLDPDRPTRIGNSVTQDSCPDLTSPATSQTHAGKTSA